MPPNAPPSGGTGAAPRGPAPPSDPVFACIYGPSGIGKTTDSGRAFPNGLFIAAPGALGSIRSTLGYAVATATARDIPEATKILASVRKEKKFDAVVVDDFSFLAEQTFATLEKKHTGFKLWGALRDVTLEFRDEARYAGCHVAVSCWEQAPVTKPDGSRVRGGPMLSGKLPEQLPAMCDIVLRCGHEPMRKPWAGVYRCSPDPNYVMKDRLSVVSDPSPMNLGEILRAAGYVISRHRELPWQEEVVAQIAGVLYAGDPATDSATANTYYAHLLQSGIAAPFARMTVTDAMDRVVIARARAARELVFM